MERPQLAGHSRPSNVLSRPRVSPERAAALERIERQLRDRVARTEDRLREMESSLSEMLRDRSTIQEDRDATRQVVSAVHADLRLLHRALERFADGRYGWCNSCGGEIPVERLEAVPTATSCARCA